MGNPNITKSGPSILSEGVSFLCLVGEGIRGEKIQIHVPLKVSHQFFVRGSQFFCVVSEGMGVEKSQIPLKADHHRLNGVSLAGR